jgi:natural product precursor
MVKKNDGGYKMKTKQFSKKLSLHKKTVANLNAKDMNEVKGGSIYSDCTCNPETVMSCNTRCFVPETLCVCVTKIPATICC